MNFIKNGTLFVLGPNNKLVLQIPMTKALRLIDKHVRGLK